MGVNGRGGGSWEGDVWKLPSVFVALCAMSVSSLLGGNVVAVSLLWRQVFYWASYLFPGVSTPQRALLASGLTGSILWRVGCSWPQGAMAISQPPEKLAWPWRGRAGPTPQQSQPPPWPTSPAFCPFCS